MQDCTYVYEYRDPRNGHTIFVGRGKKLDAWAPGERALRGMAPRDAGGLHWFLRGLIEDGRPVADLAPFIVGCYVRQTLADTEVARRIEAYGLANLLNSKATLDAKGVPALPVSNCGPGAVCEFQFNRVSHLEVIPRQVGVFGCFVAGAHLGRPVGGNWHHYPIIHDSGFIAEQRKAAIQAQPEQDERPPDEFLMEFATRGMAECLRQEQFNAERAKRFAGVLRSLLKRDFFIVSVDGQGEPVEYFDQRIDASQYALGDKVMRDVKQALRFATAKELPAVWAMVEDGTFLRNNGANQTAIDPNAPALPPPNHIPFDPKKRKPFKQFPPTPVAVKPTANDPDLMGALARLAHLVHGGSPAPTNGTPMTYEEVEIERMRLG